MMYLLPLLDRKLGRCFRCMRQAFIATLVAWIVLAICEALTDDWRFVLPATALTTATTALWLAHVLTASLRAFRQAPRSAQAATGTPSGRRLMLVELARILALSTTIAALPLRSGLAQNCQCGPGTKPGYNVYLKQCFCCPTNTTVCYDQQSNWCCLDNGCSCRS